MIANFNTTHRFNRLIFFGFVAILAGSKMKYKKRKNAQHEVINPLGFRSKDVLQFSGNSLQV